jgi:hypothetical protein
MSVNYNKKMPDLWQAAWRAFVSLFVTLLPKCGLCLAAYLNLFNILGISVVKYYVWILPLLSTLLCISLVISFFKAKKLKDYRAFYFLLIGIVILVVSKTLVEYFALNWLGMGLIFFATVFQLLQSRKICSRTIFK